MRKIEETISAQANKIKALKATVERLREELGKDVNCMKSAVNKFETNIEEVMEFFQIEEVKATASVADLRGTFDVQLKAAAESTDKKIKDSVEAVRAETVRSMVNQAKKIEEIRTSFDKQICEAVNQVVEEKLEVTDKTKFKKSAMNGIYFTGLDVIAKREKWAGDITSVVHNVLHKTGSAPYYTDVIAVHPRNSPQSSARSAIIYFQSVYHKIRMMLFREKYVKIGIRDLFNPADVLMSKALTAKGFELKKRDVISKFRISNLEDTPTMLIAKRGGAYKKVTDVQLEEMLRRST